MMSFTKNSNKGYKTLLKNIFTVLGTSVLFLGLVGCSLKPVENQTLDVDGIQVHIESNGKMSQDTMDKFIEAIKGEPDYLKKTCTNIYLMNATDLTKKHNEINKEEGVEEENSTANFEYQNQIYINAANTIFSETIAHEMWHSYDEVYYNTSTGDLLSQQSDFVTLYNAAPDSVSDYGATDSIEFFAEAGSLYVNNPDELKEKNIDVFNYFETLPKN